MKIKRHLHPTSPPQKGELKKKKKKVDWKKTVPNSVGRRELGNKVGRKFVKSGAYVTATTSLIGNIGKDKKHMAIHASFQN